MFYKMPRSEQVPLCFIIYLLATLYHPSINIIHGLSSDRGNSNQILSTTKTIKLDMNTKGKYLPPHNKQEAKRIL